MLTELLLLLFLSLASCPVAFFWASCPCCGSCIVFQDTFDRSDSTSLGSDWSEDNGDWKILSNSLQLNTPAAGNRVTYTGSTTGVTTIQCDIQSTADGDEMGFLLSYTDANNYNAVIFKFGAASEIRWKSVAAGVTTNVSESVTLATSTSYTVLVHKNSNQRVVKINGVISAVLFQSSAGTVKWGLYIESITGTPQFDNFQLLSSGTGCEQIKCQCCKPGDSIYVNWKITVTGWADGLLPCATGGLCNTNLNGVFYSGVFCDSNYTGICPSQICGVPFESRYGEFTWPVLSQGIGPYDTSPTANVCHARAQYNLNGSTAHVFEKTKIFDACGGSVHTLTATATTNVDVCDSTGVAVTMEAI